MSRRNSSREKFITHDNFKDIWTRDRLREVLESVGLRIGKDLVIYVETFLLKTISILIYTRWDSWPKFSQIFLDGTTGFRKDNALPYSSNVLEEEDFLGPADGAAFENTQYMFIPVIIEEGKNLIFDANFRLPFINVTDQVIGQGGYGEVTKVVIARGSFLHETKFGNSLAHDVSTYSIS